MDLREDWMKVSEETNFRYDVKCPRCASEIIISQKGQDISRILDDVISTVHVNNIYDAFVGYISGKKVEVEVERNKLCIVNLPLPPCTPDRPV